MTAQMMLVVLAAVLPGAALLALLAWRGRPLRYLLACIALGSLACIPALLLERLFTVRPWEISNLGIFLVFAVVAVGAVEECCKLAFWYIGPARWTSGHADEYDSILYAACIGLGFATTENIAYCVQGGLSLALARAFTAIPAHTVFGIIMGAWLGAARARARVGWGTGGLVLTGLLLAIAAHGLYDALAFQSSKPALVLLGLGLAASVAWCVLRVRAARARSPFYGGRTSPLPPPLALTFQPENAGTKRIPWIAALLSIVPGGGQMYNGQLVKAALFASLALFNAVLYSGAVLFSEQPLLAIDWLDSMGLQQIMRRSDIRDAIAQRWLLPPVFASAFALGGLLGCVDAFLTARSTRPQRHSFGAHGVVLSYMAHIAVAIALAFAPVLADKMEAANPPPAPPPSKALPSAGDKMSEVTWVEKIDGWEVAAQPKKAPPQPALPAPAPAATRKPPPPPAPPPAARPVPVAIRTPRGVPRPARTIDVPAPTVADGPSIQGVEPRTRAEGDRPPTQDRGDRPPTQDRGDRPPTQDRDRTRGVADAPPVPEAAYSYNQYLTYRLHKEQGALFQNVPKEVWVIVRYEIGADGTLLDSEVLDMSGEPSDAERVLGVLNRCSPFRPLPVGFDRVTVTELFWAMEFKDFPPHSLAESLSQLPDGRLIRE